ncbi:8-oxo-dGTP diphosphatase [Agromyces sp. SYSU T00194]|uniref:8-oxo-dGTP diphosphatase n=1 Tax=Agromyces chitinivorans TaxID=3158560 RepID=UPI003399D8FF
MLPRVCVCYLLRDGEGGRQVLLGRKKEGLGAGRLVGLGGKLEPGESAVAAAVREVYEESGVTVAASDLEHRGRLTYRFPTRSAWSQESDVFVTERFDGVPGESDELVPAWYPVARLPLGEMWDDARFWLPGVLAGGRVRRAFRFGSDLASVVAEDDPAA